MDSQEAANQATIRNATYGKVLVIIGIVTVALCAIAAYFAAFPRQPAPAGGGIMVTGWLPVLLLLGGATFIGIALLVTASKRWRNGQLQAALAISTVKEKEASENANTWRIEAHETNLRANDEKGQKDSLQTLYRESERQLTDLTWLSNRAGEEAEKLSDYVVITDIRPCFLSLNRDRGAHIEIVIRNESLFDITIHGEGITGSFLFEQVSLHDPARADSPAGHPITVNLKPREPGTLAIFQPFLMTEAERIEEALSETSAKFWLNNLTIPISASGGAIAAKAHNPVIKVAHDIYLKEFGALTLEEEAITPKELITSINALPPDERIRIYKAALRVYNESLVRLHEDKENMKYL